MNRISAGSLFFGVLLSVFVAMPGLAQQAIRCPVPEPAGPVLLDVIVLAGEAGQSDKHHFQLDRSMLEALPEDGIETTTIWTFGLQRFRGARLYSLLQCLGVEDGLLTLSAKNEYLIEIPVDEVRPDGALIAYERNGAPMPTREKGPLWLVYPYDSDPAFRTETIYAQSIWQLDRIEITP